jgi:hypothetical protein
MKFEELEFFERGGLLYKSAIILGEEDGLYEIAILEGKEGDWYLCYTTPITDDVVKGLSEEDVESYIEQVKALPKAEIILVE